jgi:Cyclic nucleotide-binding domain/Major Facilitator Superfamily
VTPGATAQRFELLKRAWRNASLRRLCLATAGFRMAELAVWIAMIAYAYTAGGVREASAVTIAQLVPATVFALAVGGLIRRHGAGAVLRWGLAFQSAGMVVAAVFLREGVNPIAFAGAIVAASAITTTRPAQSVMTPTMVDGADELTAANVFAGALHAVAGLIGPAAAAVIMTAVGSWAVFAVMACVVAVAAAAVWRLPAARTAGEEDPESLVAGLRAIVHEPGPRVMVLAVASYYVVIGAIDVLAVVIAVEILGRTEAFSGYLTTVVGVGCVIAGSISLAVIGRRWISPWILTSAVAIGAALVVVSLVGSSVVASMLVLVMFGVAEATYELTALMLLQRVSRLDLIGHIFALVESLQMAMLAVGTAIVPLAVELFGSEWAPAAVGVLFVVMVGALSTRIISIDRHARVPITEMAALRMTPLFGGLPGPALETVAREARRIEASTGEIVVRQGDHGTEYFAVISGHLTVSKDGTEVRELGRGDGFGEIALIRDVPRTATIRATSDVVLLAVAREPFLTAVTGHASTRDRASFIAAEHLDPQ